MEGERRDRNRKRGIEIKRYGRKEMERKVWKVKDRKKGMEGKKIRYRRKEIERKIQKERYGRQGREAD